MSAETKQYSGDGAIHTCSNVFGGGYAIDFPSFDASRSYDASYRLSNVPPTRRDHAVLLLRFNHSGLTFGATQKRKKAITSTFRFTLLDAKGVSLHSAELHASSAVWTENQGTFGIYELEKSHLRFQQSASYTLRVSYTPGPVPPPANRLYFAIDNCAFK